MFSGYLNYKSTCMVTCLPSKAPKQCGNCDFISNSDAIFCQSAGCSGIRKKEGCNCFHILSSVFDMFVWAVDFPILNCL